MLPISAIDAVGPAFRHTKEQLLQPFRMAQWAKLAFVGFLAGELSSGGCNGSSFQSPSRTGGEPHFPLSHANLLQYAALIALHWPGIVTPGSANPTPDVVTQIGLNSGFVIPIEKFSSNRVC